MSWIDKIKTDMTITCGDGRSYVPYWINASKSVEYNVATFEFKGLPGTLVYRGTPRGTRYQLTLFFQGEDHLDQANAFLDSSADSRPWTISHPLYDNLLVQPTALTIDNTALNQTAITGLVIETIPVDAATVSNVSPVDKIAQDKEDTDLLFNQTFADDVPVINAVDTSTLSKNIGDIYTSVSQKITDSKWKDAYFNAVNKANAALNNPIYDTITTMQAVRDFTTMPYQFSDDLRTRLNMFVSQFTILSGTVSTLFSRSSKKIYENNAGISIAGMLLSAVTNIGSTFANALDVLSVIDTIVGVYNQFMYDLDTLQSENGGSPDSYIPDSNAVTSLSQLLTTTLNALLDIASDGKQQRIAYLSEDSNVIQVAHTLYGYSGDDAVIDKVIDTNGITMNELLLLKKGRKIIYYV